jgi:ribosomal-protein-alanine N-acetyltransferase
MVWYWMLRSVLTSKRVQLEEPSKGRETEFLDAVARSRRLHRNRVTPPDEVEKYQAFLNQLRSPWRVTFFVVLKAGGDLIGVVNIDSMIRGAFQSGYLGYYGFIPYVGSGLMREGLIEVVSKAFHQLNLHRLEANIQPDNERSIALVRSLGFSLEGFSPKYLKVCGRWRDHERWAVLAEEWEGAPAS